jgi:hypothetical protein
MGQLRSGLIVLFVAGASSCTALAHGVAGDRYFPPTISVDDPYAAYEAHAVTGRIPTVGSSDPNASLGNVLMVGAGIEPLDGFGISVDALYRDPNTNLTPQASGFDNLYYTVKKELTINDAHEYAVSVGVAGQIGGSGSTGSDRHTSYAPTIFYAKGFGDLPQSTALLRPFAVTGVLGYQVATDATQPRALNWGFTLQYSFLYLDQHVKPTGWHEPFRRVIAVVEFPMQTCLSGACSGQVTGSINPGVVWVGTHFNLSAEAVLPVNNRSGVGAGLLFQIHRYLGK